ncbi:hypothetical protein, partial [Sphingomonas bacterium]|uniref:hypothetical protein n=1 Tax=Sphingomonas bacterium TaxID=1895847 RepID=UPI0026198D9E
MSAKTSPARRAAFMAAVAETGNQTIAAESTKVSRSWVHLHQSTDPAFRAELDAAIATAKERLAARRTDGGDMTPAPGWRSIDGEELVVRGGNGRRTQIARARLRQWTPRVEARFLSALASCCNVKAACATVGLSPASAYSHYRRWPGFAGEWEAALEIGYLRIEAALVANAIATFGASGFDPDAPIPPMTAAQAIHLLHMHKHRIHGLGRRPGKHGYPKSLADPEIRASILRKFEWIEAARLREE